MRKHISLFLNINLKLALLVLAIISVSSGLNAQNESLEQEVKVVKPYEPVVNDAYKISELPKIDDTITVKPEFEYDITPRMYDTKFKPQLIKPAKLVGEPLPRLYHLYLKAGFGSHLTPLFEAHVGSKRDELWQWGGAFTHLSSHSKITTIDAQRVYAGYSKSDVDLSGRRFFKNDQSVGAKLTYDNRANYYYGYNPDSNTVANPAPLKKAEIENQKAHLIDFKADWKTNYLDSARLNFIVNTGYQSFMAKNGIGEGSFTLNGNMNKFFEKEFLGVDMGVQTFSQSGFADTILSSIMHFNPWIGAYGKKWQVVAGVKTYHDGATKKYGFYPRLSMHYNIIDYFLIPYFELGGKYQANNYKKIFYENPYIRQDLAVQSTSNKVDLAFGFRGNISSKIAFNLKVDYKVFDNQYFYVNDTTSTWDNKFDVVYDDLSQTRLLGEIALKTKKDISFRLKASYYNYTLQKEMYAWHRPDFDMSLDVKYVIQEKIILESNMFAVSSRYAKEFDTMKNPYAKQLDAVFDVNIGAEYRVSKSLSAFAKFNNIANQRYIQWNNYSTQGFNFMLGVTYSLF